MYEHVNYFSDDMFLPCGTRIYLLHDIDSFRIKYFFHHDQQESTRIINYEGVGQGCISNRLRICEEFYARFPTIPMMKLIKTASKFSCLRNVRGDQLQILFKVFTSVLDSPLFTTCQSQFCVTVAYPTLVC